MRKLLTNIQLKLHPTSPNPYAILLINGTFTFSFLLSIIPPACCHPPSFRLLMSSLQQFFYYIFVLHNAYDQQGILFFLHIDNHFHCSLTVIVNVLVCFQIIFKCKCLRDQRS